MLSTDYRVHLTSQTPSSATVRVWRGIQLLGIGRGRTAREAVREAVRQARSARKCGGIRRG